VNVTDEDNSLDLDSLTVVLENQLEYYEQQITLGESSGYFDNLESNTQYRLSVYGNKGFGQERLDTETLTTREKVGGTILSITPTTDMHSTTYSIDVSIYDPDSKYTSVDLYYGFSWEPAVDFTYSSIPITSNRETIDLFDVFTTYPFHIYIEGTTLDGVELLDEIWVTPPFELYADLYLAYYNNNEVAFHSYGSSQVDDLEYKMNIYKDERLIKTDYFTPSSDLHSHNKWLIENLRPDTTYLFECVAVYTNPQTLRVEEQIFYTEELTTTKDYSYTYTIEEFDTYMEVSITLQDPDDVFTYIFFEVFDTTGEFDMFIDGESYTFELDGENKVFTFSINIPIVEMYEITIGMNSSVNNYVRQIIETTNEE